MVGYWIYPLLKFQYANIPSEKNIKSSFHSVSPKRRQTMDKILINTSTCKSPILSEGIYPFTIVSADNIDLPATSKLPACKGIQLTLEIQADIKVKIKTVLKITPKLFWQASEFCLSIGCVPDSNGNMSLIPSELIGREGLVMVVPTITTDSAGKKSVFNSILRYVIGQNTTDTEKNKHRNAQASESNSDDDEEILPFCND